MIAWRFKFPTVHPSFSDLTFSTWMVLEGGGGGGRGHFLVNFAPLWAPLHQSAPVFHSVIPGQFYNVEGLAISSISFGQSWAWAITDRVFILSYCLKPLLIWGLASLLDIPLAHQAIIYVASLRNVCEYHNSLNNSQGRLLFFLLVNGAIFFERGDYFKYCSMEVMR